MVLTMVRVIWRELINVRVEAEKYYGYETPAVMLGHYLWGTLQDQRVMDNFLRNQFQQHLDVAP